MKELKAPYPYFGGKSKITDEVWEALGDVDTYIEPFCGSAAMLLGRPGKGPWIETVNDVNGFVSNFWRSIAKDPEAVIHHIQFPVSEVDLHCRHHWLWARNQDLLKNLEADPEWCDPKIAGWWAWGKSTWFGGGWCEGKLHRIKPQCSGHVAGHGVHRLAFDAREDLTALHERLKRVRVLCGDWKRVVTPSVLWGDLAQKRVCGVFLDPPYDVPDRNSQCYGNNDDLGVSKEVQKWCLENGDNPTLRIALSGYDIEHQILESHGWSVIAWTSGGIRRSDQSKANSHRERVWFSPHCLKSEENGILSLMGG